MEPLMPELESVLIEHVGARRHRSRRVRPRPAVSVLAVAASVVIVAAVSIVALGLHRSSGTSPEGTATSSSGVAAPHHLWVESRGGVSPPTQLAPGQYWYVRTLIDEPMVFRLSRGRRPPVIRAFQDVLLERWIGRSGQVSRSVQTPAGPLRFASAQDEARWRAAGSPNDFPDNGRRVSYAFGSPGFGALAEFSYRDLQLLPTEPGQLIERIRARLEARGTLRGAPNNPARRSVLAELTANTILNLLEAPSPARVHGAILAAARELAGANTDRGDDLIGRRGIVLRLPLPSGSVLINPTSDALLADSTFGTMNTYLAAGLVRSSTAIPHGFPHVLPRSASASASGHRAVTGSGAVVHRVLFAHGIAPVHSGASATALRRGVS